MDIPPPPPGFTLDANTPPPGFKLDRPASAVPPPPPGFTLDKAEAIKNFVSDVGARAGKAVEDIGKAESEPLKEKGNPVAKLGEVAGRGTRIAGDMFSAATALPEAALSQTAKSTGAAEKLGTYVAGKVGGTPEEAKQVGKKLEGSTANVIGSTGVGTIANVAGGTAAPKIASAAKLAEDGTIATGAKHADIPGNGKEGFVTTDGKFLDRKTAEPIAKAQGQLVQPEKVPGSLHSEDIGRPKPQPYQSKIFSPDEPMASTQPLASQRGVADKLYQSRNAIRADYKELGKWMEPLKNVPNVKELGTKFMDHLDDPKANPLTPQEKSVFDNTVGVMREEIDNNRKEIKASGFNPNYLEGTSDSLGGAIRQRKGAGTPMDKLTGEKGKPRPPEGGRSLSRSAGTFKGRNMMALTKDGERKIVHIDREGNVFDASKRGDPIGHVDESGALQGGGKLSEATRKEIEAATGGEIQYHDNAFGVYGTTLLQTRRALRSVRILNEIKKSPDFNLIAHGPFTKGEVPKGWVEIPNSPEFRGYRFDPRYAEEIEDFLHGTKFDAGELDKLDRLNRFVLNTSFWANPYHAFNMNNAFLVTKGLGGLAKDLPGTTSDLLKSIKSIATRDKFNMAQVRAGVPMRGLDSAGEDFQKKVLDVMGVKMRQDPATFAQFAKRYGFDNPTDFYKHVSKLSHKATFSWQDVLQQTLERGYMRQGMSRAQATEKIAKTFMNYRSPARVADQRWIGKAMQGQAWLNFPKYAYGRLNGLYNILKDSSKLDTHALDQLITIGVLYEFGQHVINPWLQEVTGKPNAEMSDFGYEVFPELAGKTMGGQRTPGQDFQSLLAPGYAVQGLDLARGVIPYLGKSISTPGESPSQVGFDYANQFADKFGPVQRANQLAQGKIDKIDLLLEQLGVKFPTDVQSLKSVKRDLKARDKYGNPVENLIEGK